MVLKGTALHLEAIHTLVVPNTVLKWARKRFLFFGRTEYHH